jgi:hypothetical protein
MKLATLQQTFQTQTMIYQQYGAGNGLVSLTQIRNTLADILALGGYRNAERYFNPMNPQMEQQIVQQMMAQQQAAQQGQGDPNAATAQAMIQAEQIKAQAKMQSDAAKMQLQAQTDAAKIQAGKEAKLAELQSRSQNDINKLRTEFELAAREDDLNRDKMHQDLLVEAAKILGQYGTAVDIERVRAMQQSPRDDMGNI